MEYVYKEGNPAIGDSVEGLEGFRQPDRERDKYCYDTT